jgi:hypothetical protein
MFRDPRDAALQQADDLRRELDTVRAENAAMREHILAKAGTSPFRTVLEPYRRPIEQLTPGQRVAFGHHSVRTFPVWALVVLHVLTFGLSSLVHFGLQNDRLPNVAHDDPSGAKAIGFSFIPYFNLYWIVFSWLRLTDRVNFQFRLRGRAPPVSRGYVTFCAVVTAILPLFIPFGVLASIFAVAQMRKALNEIAAMPPVEADTPARVRADVSVTDEPEAVDRSKIDGGGSEVAKVS